MLTIGIIDRHPIAQLGLKLELNAGFDNPAVYAASDFSAFRALKKDRIHNTFILGFQLSEGYLYTSKVVKLKSFYPAVPLILYGDPLNYTTIRRLLNLGVKGYILKRNNGSDLICFVNAVINGSHFINTDFKNESEVHASIRGVLTQKQFAIASLLIQGMSNADVCEKHNLKASTVSTFKNIIFKKMNFTNVIQLMETICSGI